MVSPSLFLSLPRSRVGRRVLTSPSLPQTKTTDPSILMDIIFVNDSICTGSFSSFPSIKSFETSELELKPPASLFHSFLSPQSLATLKSASGLDRLQKLNLRWTDEEDWGSEEVQERWVWLLDFLFGFSFFLFASVRLLSLSLSLVAYLSSVVPLRLSRRCFPHACMHARAI